ncbi:hypothetical protein QE380_000152 [Acinetobacter baylyi]|uniref:Uncharacterized protein n=1 Tax=Acinetobacter baylyi TaxID=202950 RepID=A0ABU0URQ8_ACIBI|nr:hypothetical protein [Acinetobacter baylyi]MDQ1207229.1 hypothetical protein [Acinetobacter baylyi]MDR6105689.1 hypothetical protein [Acinetobacter baylyi]MDR6187591.1 hypothetical protein [Acinetobacter baylyi]
MSDSQDVYPVFTVSALDLATHETCLILEDQHWNIIEVFHTNDLDEAMNKLNEFNESYPKALMTNNAILATHYYQYRIEALKNLIKAEGG